MKKSFFLLTAALVAMFSFFACSDDKEDPPAKPSSPSVLGCKVSGICTPVLEEENCTSLNGTIDNSCSYTKGCETQGVCVPIEASSAQGCTQTGGTVVNACSVVYCKIGSLCSKQYEYLCTSGEVVTSCDAAPTPPSSTVQTACNWPNADFCIEYISGLSAADINEAKAECTKNDKDWGRGTVVNKCPSGGLECGPYTDEDGYKWKEYVYGEEKEYGCGD